MHSWLSGGENSNANTLVNIQDPLNNYAYEMHQYFDHDSSGTHHGLDQNCISKEKVIQKFEQTTNWLKEHHKRAFLGEFGVQENVSCIAALDAAMTFMKTNKDTWIGWTYWTAGDWMAKYPLNYLSDKNINQRFKVITNALKH